MQVRNQQESQLKSSAQKHCDFIPQTKVSMFFFIIYNFSIFSKASTLILGHSYLWTHKNVEFNIMKRYFNFLRIFFFVIHFLKPTWQGQIFHLQPVYQSLTQSLSHLSSPTLLLYKPWKKLLYRRQALGLQSQCHQNG